MNEISRGACNQGDDHLHSAFLHLLELPEDVELIDGCVLPKDIVKCIKESLIFNVNKDMAVESDGEKQKNDTSSEPDS